MLNDPLKIAKKEAIYMTKSPFEAMRVSGDFYLNALKNYKIDKKKVNDVWEFCHGFENPKGKKQKIALLPWQALLIIYIFGMKEIEEVACLLCRKNGKSTAASMMAISSIVFSDENAPECTMFAATVEQANMVYGTATNLLSFSDMAVDGHTAVRNVEKGMWRTGQKLLYPQNMGVIDKRAADRSSALGLNSSLTILDEAQLLDKEFFGTIQTGRTSQRDFQKTLYISTAGRDINSYYKYMIDSLMASAKAGEYGKIAPILFMPPHGIKDAPKASSRRVWKLLNPSLRGGLETMDNFASRYKTMKAIGGEDDFKVFHLNFFGASVGDRICDDEQIKAVLQDFDEDVFKRNICTMGVDAGSTSSLSAVCLMTKEDNIYYAKVRYYISKHIYQQWYNGGKRYLFDELNKKRLYIDGEKRQDYIIMHEHLLEDDEKYNIDKITYDTYNQSTVFSTNIENHFGGRAEMIGNRGKARAPLTNMLFDTTRGGTIKAGKNGMLAEEFQNAVREDKPEWSDITRPSYGNSEYIDGLCAIMYAFSYYKEHIPSFDAASLSAFTA